MAENIECATIGMIDVLALSGLSRPTIWRLIHSNRMPQPLPHGLRTKRFNREQIDEWLRGEWQPPEESAAA